MHIAPTSKGYLGGKVRFRFHNRLGGGECQWTDCSGHTATGGVAIGAHWTADGGREGKQEQELQLKVEVEVEVGPDVRYLLVVEKEGVYKRLCEDAFHLRLGCLLVTGCGYPDIATRACVARIAKTFPVGSILAK